jgi:hypothetical protein
MCDYFRSSSGISSTPIRSRRERNRSIERLLVIASATLWVVEIFYRQSISLVAQSRTKWYRTSICLEALWCTRFFAKATALWLSLSTVEIHFGLTCRNIQASRLSQSASFDVSDAATYSASVILVAVQSCSFDLHEMAPYPNLKEYPDIDFRLSR